MQRIIKSVLALWLLFISYSSVYSQNMVHRSDVLLDKLRLNKSIKGIESVLYSDIKGDPYIFSEFHQGELALRGGDTYTVLLRYDIFGNQMHIKEKDQIFGILHPEKISGITIDTLKFIYSTFKDSRGAGTHDIGSYFIVRTEGKCRLLIKKNMRIQDAEPPKLYQDVKPPRFIPLKDTYYFKQGEEAAVRINGKQDLVNLLSDKKNEVENFIRSDRLALNRIEDLERVVKFYNGL